jgi:hypothetical protein
MASFRIIAANSTLGPFGTLVQESEILAASCTVEQLIEHGIIETTTTKTTSKEKD